MLSAETPADPDADTFSTRLLASIIDNVQIEVYNIHLRYEDNRVPGVRMLGAILVPLTRSLIRFLAAAILCSWHHLGKVLRMRVELLAIDDSPVRNSCRAISTNSKFEEVLARDSDKLIYKVRCLAEFAECDVTEKVIRRCSRPC